MAIKEIPSESRMKRRFQISIPKSGTHLVSHICRTGWFSGKYTRPGTRRMGFLAPSVGTIARYNMSADCRHVQGHLTYIPEWEHLMQGRVSYFLYRDPRDILTSWYYYLDKCVPDHILSTLGSKNLNLKEAEDRLMEQLVQLVLLFERYSDWLRHPRVTSIRYEGILTNPEKELAPLAEQLEEPLDYLVERSRHREAPTFRKGIIGDWKNLFKPRHIEVFNRDWRHIMDVFGYSL